MTVPERVERCGYTVEPVLNRDGTFNPIAGQMRISEGGGHTLFPARLYAELTDDGVFMRVMNQTFFTPDDWAPPAFVPTEPMPIADTELDDEIEQILGRFIGDALERIHARNAICRAISARGFDVYARRP